MNDAYDFVLNRCEMDKYSVLAPVGGDGSINEILRGMMQRPDKKQLPIAMLPNGSGNDTARHFYNYSV